MIKVKKISLWVFQLQIRIQGLQKCGSYANQDPQPCSWPQKVDGRSNALPEGGNATSDSIPGLEDDDLHAEGLELLGGGETRNTRTNHHHHLAAENVTTNGKITTSKLTYYRKM